MAHRWFRRVPWPAHLALVALALAACLEVPPQRAKDALDVKDIKGPEGVGLETACTPTGMEMCFDARDNNCNGVIDEGCGLHTGILQFTIAWESAEADVDLAVTDATGEEAKKGEASAGGLIKDKDCPKDCHGQNVENVYLAEGDPRRGRYKVRIKLDKLNGATPPLRVRFGARVGQRWFGMTVDLAPGAGTEERAFEFTL